MTDETPPVQQKRPKRVSWRTIILALLTIATFIAIYQPDAVYVRPLTGGSGVMEDRGTNAVPPMVGGAPMMDNSVYYPYPYPNPEVPVTDTREFLKVNYNASLRSRDVQGLTRQVETTVRGNGGRIDQLSSDTRYGYIRFAVPQSKYDAFRDDLEGLVGSRFIAVTISSQNLLSQKLSIEEQQRQVDTVLIEHTAARQKIVSAHSAAVLSLNTKLKADEKLIVELRRQPSTPEQQTQLQAVTDEWNVLNQQLENENSSYATRLITADANIKYAQDWKKAVATQDQAFLDNVATVTGTVSVWWISLWDIVRLYLPGYWLPVILAVLTVLSFQWDRRRWARANR